jgi:glycosyltransferase involved in cell wall biosynthesis
MAAGRPIIATNVGAMSDAVIDGVSGMLVPPRDVDRLSHALDRILTEPDTMISMGRAARSRFLERFAIARMLESHVAVYTDVLGGP